MKNKFFVRVMVIVLIIAMVVPTFIAALLYMLA